MTRAGQTRYGTCAVLEMVLIGFVAAAGTPCDPFVVAAHTWQQPVAVGLGKRYRALAADAPTRLDVNARGVAISQSPP